MQTERQKDREDTKLTGFGFSYSSLHGAKTPKARSKQQSTTELTVGVNHSEAILEDS